MQPNAIQYILPGISDAFAPRIDSHRLSSLNKRGFRSDL